MAEFERGTPAESAINLYRHKFTNKQLAAFQARLEADTAGKSESYREISAIAMGNEEEERLIQGYLAQVTRLIQQNADNVGALRQILPILDEIEKTAETDLRLLGTKTSPKLRALQERLGKLRTYITARTNVKASLGAKVKNVARRKLAGMKENAIESMTSSGSGLFRVAGRALQRRKEKREQNAEFQESLQEARAGTLEHAAETNYGTSRVRRGKGGKSAGLGDYDWGGGEGSSVDLDPLLDLNSAMLAELKSISTRIGQQTTQDAEQAEAANKLMERQADNEKQTAGPISLGGMLAGKGGAAALGAPGTGGAPGGPPGAPGGGIMNTAMQVLGLGAGAKALKSVGAKVLGKVFGKKVATTAGKEVAEVAASKGLGKLLPKLVTKSAGKAIGKSVLKKIPLVGLGAGILFAAQRVMQGDLTGAAAEVASGAASTVPGLGTAASVAIDAGLAARDISNEVNAENAPPSGAAPTSPEPVPATPIAPNVAPSPVAPPPTTPPSAPSRVPAPPPAPPPSAPARTSSAKVLLNQIAKGEGADYNTTLANGRLRPGGREQETRDPISNYRMRDIYQLQTAMLRHPDNKWKSSAVGRYQIVRQTLFGKGGTAEKPAKGSLADVVGLGPNDKFSPEVQDALGMVLLNRRGYQKFQRGEMSMAQFQDNLSKEWASVASSQTGQSFYGQHTGTSTGALMAALGPTAPTPGRSGATMAAATVAAGRTGGAASSPVVVAVNAPSSTGGGGTSIIPAPISPDNPTFRGVTGYAGSSLG